MGVGTVSWDLQSDYVQGGSRGGTIRATSPVQRVRRVVRPVSSYTLLSTGLPSGRELPTPGCVPSRLGDSEREEGRREPTSFSSPTTWT